MFKIDEVVSCIIKYDHFLNMEDMQDSDLTNLKLQKLLYYAQGHYLAEFNKQLFIDDLISWKHGPVVPTIYYYFKNYLKDHESDLIGFAVIDNDRFDSSRITDDTESFNFFERLMNYYNRYSPWGLRNMTHQEKPWVETKNGDIISINLIKDFFIQNDIKNRIKTI